MLALEKDGPILSAKKADLPEFTPQAISVRTDLMSILIARSGILMRRRLKKYKKELDCIDGKIKL